MTGLGIDFEELGGDVEGGAGLLGCEGDEARPDLVDDVALGGDGVGADEDEVDPFQEGPHGGVH